MMPEKIDLANALKKHQLVEGDPADQGWSADVSLTWPQMILAVAIGAGRRIESVVAKRRDAFGYKDNDGWETDVEGAGAEQAYCKYRGVFWPATIGNFHGADVGKIIQVRWSRKDVLIVRPPNWRNQGDNDEHLFVLVTGKMPDYQVRGWIRGGDAKRSEWEVKSSDRSPCWMVPVRFLKPIPELVIPEINE